MTPAEQLSEEMQRLAQELGIDNSACNMLPAHLMYQLLEYNANHDLAKELVSFTLRLIDHY